MTKYNIAIITGYFLFAVFMDKVVECRRTKKKKKQEPLKIAPFTIIGSRSTGKSVTSAVHIKTRFEFLIQWALYYNIIYVSKYKSKVSIYCSRIPDSIFFFYTHFRPIVLDFALIII